MRWQLVAALVSIGCTIGHPPDPETSGDEEAPVSEIDETDRCHSVPPTCIGLDPSFEDGCPDAMPIEIRFAEGSATLDDAALRALNELCLDARELVAGVTLRLVAVAPELATERIAAIRAELERCAVPAERLTDGGALPATFAPPAVTSVLLNADGCGP